LTSRSKLVLEALVLSACGSKALFQLLETTCHRAGMVLQLLVEPLDLGMSLCHLRTITTVLVSNQTRNHH